MCLVQPLVILRALYLPNPLASQYETELSVIKRNVITTLKYEKKIKIPKASKLEWIVYQFIFDPNLTRKQISCAFQIKAYYLGQANLIICFTDFH